MHDIHGFNCPSYFGVTPKVLKAAGVPQKQFKLALRSAAVSYNNTQGIERLIAGAALSPNQKRHVFLENGVYSLLHDTIKARKAAAAKRLIELGASVKTAVSNGVVSFGTILETAIEAHMPDIVAVVCDAGIAPREADFSLAMETRNADTLMVLLERCQGKVGQRLWKRHVFTTIVRYSASGRGFERVGAAAHALNNFFAASASTKEACRERMQAEFRHTKV